MVGMLKAAVEILPGLPGFPQCLDAKNSSISGQALIAKNCCGSQDNHLPCVCWETRFSMSDCYYLL